MSIRINNNIAALNSLRHLGISTDHLSASIERLSSGLRINSASDDPAGLTISEKLRSQVEGVQRASLNAQDGVSLLQVAEGALSEVHTLLHRVRELAVQASNGVYTQNDRLEIQSEIDQLIEELDRVSTTTEFNTRNLLDGSATGIASTDSTNLEVVFRDTPLEGNYEIEMKNTPGQAHVLKSDIFALADGMTRGRATDIQENILAAPPGLSQADFTNFTALDFTEIEYGATGNGLHDFQVEVAAAAVDEVSVIDHHYHSAGGKAGFVITTGFPLAAGETGYYQIEIVDVEGDAVLEANDEEVTVQVSRYDAYGELLETDQVTDTKTNLTAGGLGWFAGLAGGPTAVELSVQLAQVGDRLEEGDKWLFGVNAAADFAGNVLQFRQDMNELEEPTATLITPGAGAFAGAGDVDMMIVALDAAGNEIGRAPTITMPITAATDEIQLTWAAVPGAASYVLYSGDSGAGVTGFVNVGAVTTYTYNNPAVLGGAPPFPDQWNSDAGTASRFDLDEDRFSLYTQIGATLTGGADYDTSLAFYDRDGRIQFATGNVRLGLAGTAPAAGTAEFNLFETSVAERTTQLRDLDKFQAEGDMTLVDSGQVITVYGDGEKASIVIQGNDTLEEFTEKIRNAIITSVSAGGLGMGVDGNTRRVDVGGFPAGVDGNTAVFIDNPAQAGDEVIEGTIVIRSTIPDTEGRLVFAGDQGLLDALSLATIQEPTDNLLEVTIRDAHTGVLVGAQAVSDGVVRGLIPGVDVFVDQSVDVSVTFDSARRDFNITSAVGSAVEYLHIVDSAIRLQTGANEGQVLRASIGQIDSTALDLDELLVVSQEFAEEAITKVDRAIAIVSRERAKLGAYLNRLDLTTRVLDIQAENLTASESRIRDLDMAEETVSYTRDQILQQAGTAVLAQANAIPQSVLQLLQ